ncbi:Ribokinase-like protein [Ramaria rubella]|nr:Ribokinase-like protein [Ramaria rubella]
MTASRHFATLCMFLIDEFIDGNNDNGEIIQSQETWIGGGAYTAIGARIWLPESQVGMIVDRGQDFPPSIQSTLMSYGDDMWLFRDPPNHATTRVLNIYKNDQRSFKYLTPRIRLTPQDLLGNKLEKCATLHFMCTPARAASIVADIRDVEGWQPVTIYEPIPDHCIPEELPMLTEVLSSISILSPNAEEALSLLSLPLPPTQDTIEQAASMFLELGVGNSGNGTIIIRSGGMGAYVMTRSRGGRWVPAYWTTEDQHKIIDVTGAGNSFLGGLAAGLSLSNGDVYKATIYATVSASFIIEQRGLPSLSSRGEWNGDKPGRRLNEIWWRNVTPWEGNLGQNSVRGISIV